MCPTSVSPFGGTQPPSNISYRIFNTTQGPMRIQQSPQQPAGAASPAYSTTHFTHHALVEITFQPFIARALMTTCHDLRMKTFSFLHNHNRQLMHAISARAQRLTQDLTFPVLYPQVTTEWHIKQAPHARRVATDSPAERTCIRSLSYCLQTLQLNIFQCQF